MVSTATDSPAVVPAVVVSARLDPGLSRWLWLVKWLLALPHYLVLAALWVAFLICSLIALVGIVVTGRYPRVLFPFTAGVLRWTWRVSYYGYGALGTDRYPPFSLADDPDYPARLQIAYPENLSRGLALVKWWLLAIPHYLVVGVLLGSGQNTLGLIGVLVLIAGVALLFTGRYPTGVFDLVLGLDRWVLRVAAYAGLLTDVYPPFRLDQGGLESPGPAGPARPIEPTPGPRSDGTEPSWGPPDAGDPTAGAAGPTGQVWAPPAGGSQPGGAGATAFVLAGALLLLPGLGLFATGAAATVADRALRDDDGLITSPSVALGTSTSALASKPVDLQLDGPDLAYLDEALGEVRIVVRTLDDAPPVFLGVGPTDQVLPYLSSFAYDRVADLGEQPPDLRRVGSGTTAVPPGSLDVWAASDTGTGRLSVRLPVDDGSWTAVVMRADARPGVAVRAEAGATLPDLGAFAAGLLVAGVVMLGAGTLLVVAGAHRAGPVRTGPSAAEPPSPAWSPPPAGPER